MKPDVEIRNEGSIFTFTPVTKTAQDWINENVQTEGWQWLGKALCVDQHCAGPLAEGMASSGLVLA